MTSDKSLSQGPESASRGMGLNLLILQSGSGNSQGKSSLSNGTSPSGLGGFGKMPSSNEGQSEYFFAYCFFCTWQSGPGPGSVGKMPSSRPLLTRDGLSLGLGVITTTTTTTITITITTTTTRDNA